jgi:DNA-binding CsgD family transcriptional regulator
MNTRGGWSLPATVGNHGRPCRPPPQLRGGVATKSGILPEQVEELWSGLDTTRRLSERPSSLGTAGVRLLPWLSAHLSSREIGERLDLSRHTVKSQAMSIYRKLGVSSRGQAVQRLQEISLIGHRANPDRLPAHSCHWDDVAVPLAGVEWCRPISRHGCQYRRRANGHGR